MTNEKLVALIKQGDNGFFEQLYKQNYGIIYNYARKFSAYAEFEDLIQEGYIALVNAVNAFDGAQGYKFITYLTKALTSHFYRYCNKNQTAVHIPEYMLKQIAQLQSFKSDFIKLNQKEPLRADYTDALKITDEQLDNLLFAMKSANIASLDEPIENDGEDTVIDLISDGNSLEDKITDADEEQYIHETLTECVNKLREAQRDIIHKRYFENMTQSQIAAIRGCSSTNIANIERKALNALQEDIQLQSLYLSCYDCYSAYHYSVQRFKDSGMSATEYVVERKLERENKLEFIKACNKRALEQDREINRRNTDKIGKRRRESILQKRANNALKSFLHETGVSWEEFYKCGA